MKSYLYKIVILLAVFIVGLGLDWSSKKWAAQELQFDEPIVIIKDFLDFRYTENRAMAFSMLKNLPENIRYPLVLVLPLISMVLLLFFIWRFKKRDLMILLPYILILAGAVGNIADKFRDKYVIDFIHLHYKYQFSWPVFNVADILVCLGAFWLLVQVVTAKEAYSLEKV